MDQFKKLLKLAIEKQATRIQLRSDMYPHLFTQQSEKFSCSVFSEVKHEWIKEILQPTYTIRSKLWEARYIIFLILFETFPLMCP